MENYNIYDADIQEVIQQMRDEYYENQGDEYNNWEDYSNKNDLFGYDEAGFYQMLNFGVPIQ